MTEAVFCEQDDMFCSEQKCGETGTLVWNVEQQQEHRSQSQPMLREDGELSDEEERDPEQQLAQAGTQGSVRRTEGSGNAAARPLSCWEAAIEEGRKRVKEAEQRRTCDKDFEEKRLYMDVFQETEEEMFYATNSDVAPDTEENTRKPFIRQDSRGEWKSGIVQEINPTWQPPPTAILPPPPWAGIIPATPDLPANFRSMRAPANSKPEIIPEIPPPEPGQVLHHHAPEPLLATPADSPHPGMFQSIMAAHQWRMQQTRWFMHLQHVRQQSAALHMAQVFAPARQIAKGKNGPIPKSEHPLAAPAVESAAGPSFIMPPLVIPFESNAPSEVEQKGKEPEWKDPWERQLKRKKSGRTSRSSSPESLKSESSTRSTENTDKKPKKWKKRANNGNKGTKGAKIIQMMASRTQEPTGEVEEGKTHSKSTTKADVEGKLDSVAHRRKRILRQLCLIETAIKKKNT
ncbi:unnamed protein product [Cyprideis torosa]|uniref:Uncharacterized protein n=1 Tax=Cyprideis torosa TaxID=163714 RepID=A0A7R8W161_9CRUS|nr:unnamed protein product [Cyprideis torosa]CAG0880363.1 unnamed protein product [Cyprideis torosa]